MKYLTVIAVLIACAFGRVLKVGPELDWRIVGGAPAAPGQFPYQVSLRVAPNIHFCGGSILNTRWILTAAHCIETVTAQDVTVVVGTNTLNAGGVRIAVSRIITHEGYSNVTIENDISLLELAQDIQLNANVQTIELQTEHIGVADCVLSGWGMTSFPGVMPNNLQFLVLRTITNYDCRTVWGSFIFDSQICTLNRAGEGTCMGDSGGPLTCNGKLSGIVSWGNPCANGYPDVFGRASSYITWINNAMNS